VYGFVITVLERNQRFDGKFKSILEEIVPDLNEKYTITDKTYYKKDQINLEEYDKLLSVLKQILAAFGKYTESMG
jgi:hypothetical protein